MAENHFTSTIESLFKGMDQFVTTKTVVGEPVQVGETIIIPLIDVTCGMAAGAFAEGSKQKDKRLWRNERQDESKCCLGDPEWCDQAGQCKEPGCSDQGDRYGSGSDQPLFRRKTGCIRRNSRHCKRNSSFLRR